MKFPAYRLFVLAVTAVVLVGLWLFLERTNVGLIVRAGSRDALMVRALGIDLGRVWFVVFGLGIGMAGLAGILAGPLRGVYAEMGVEIIIEAFVVVVVGGMGSLPGAIVAGLLIGEVISLTTFFAPKLAEIVVFMVMAVVLLARPSGLFGEAGLAQ
jgi:branched-chain amino acid transport system permease protein